MANAKDIIKAVVDERDEVVVQIKLKPECLNDLMARNERDLIDYCMTSKEVHSRTWVYGKCAPWGGFCDCWQVKMTSNKEVILTLPLGFDFHFLDSDYKKRNPLCDIDVLLSALVAIKKHVKPEEILIQANWRKS